MSQYTRN